MADPTTTCRFDHPGLAALGQPVFRLTEGDRLPALAIQLDGAEAVLPLAAVAKFFGIDTDSDDGRMLDLIGRSLQFVPSLGLNDPLPSEVLTGEASWSPSRAHRQIATARLQRDLLRWIALSGPEAKSAPMFNEPEVDAGLRRLAAELALPGGGPAVAALIEQLAEELSFMECMRERLLRRVQAMTRHLIVLAHDGTPLPQTRRETILQVARLAATGQAEITTRFERVDDQTKDLVAALRELEQRRSVLHTSRDWLYTALIAWDPNLRDFEDGPIIVNGERIWKVMDRLYRFLAPRYMSTQHWQALPAPSAERARPVVW